jgi:hypothetical protein
MGKAPKKKLVEEGLWNHQVCSMVSIAPKTQFDAIKTQFRRNCGANCLMDKGFPDALKPNFDPMEIPMRPNRPI